VKAQIARRWRALSLESATPEAIALSIAAGLVLGVLPLYGCPTLLCLAMGLMFRIHVPLLHAINTATSPLQLALVLPFHKIGERLLPQQTATVGNGGWHVAASVYGFTARAVTGWFLVCLPLGIALYLALAYTLRRCRTGQRKLTDEYQYAAT